MKEITLSDSDEQVVDRLVATGIGDNAEQVVRISLQRLDEQEAELNAMREKVNTGMDQIRNGEIITPEGSVEDTHSEFLKRRDENFLHSESPENTAC